MIASVWRGFLAHVQNSGGDCDFKFYEYPGLQIKGGKAFFDGPDSDDLGRARATGKCILGIPGLASRNIGHAKRELGSV